LKAFATFIEDGLKKLISLIDPDCDGIVAGDQLKFRGAVLARGASSAGSFGETRHYTYESQDGCGSSPQYNVTWQIARVAGSKLRGTAHSGSLIQSDFGTGSHGNFEVAVLEGNQLVHYWHDSANPGSNWRRGQVISAQATGPGSLIQSDFGTGPHGNFEVAVLEGNQLVHYWHDSSNQNLPWQRAKVITAKATGPGSLIQSDFGTGPHGNFEVAVLEGNQLVHYWHDSANPGSDWQRGQVISPQATGPGGLIQSDFGTGPHGNFEVVVLEGNQLVHYWHDSSNQNLPLATR
jgi:hypothetical protein